VLNIWDRSQRDLTESYPITPSSDWFKNDYGSIRWWKIRSAYFGGTINESFVTELYKEWRDTPEYFMINGINGSGSCVVSAFVKACKRGNDVYLSMINRKFGFIDGLPNIDFFTDDQTNKYTPMLFVTLTVATEKHDLNMAWVSIGEYLNRFETLLRQKYGKFVKFRVWESHVSGYPHCHVVYYFLDHAFKVWEHFDEEGNQTFRLADKHRKAISNMWVMGNVDLQGVQDTLGAFKEVKKYITKQIWNAKGDQTNAMCTLFRKQSYYLSQFDYKKHVLKKVHNKSLTNVNDISSYISKHIDRWAKRDFIGAIWGVGTYMNVYNALNEGVGEPRLNALVKQTMCNYNILEPEIVKWEYVGFILGSDLKRFFPKLNDDWVFVVKDPPFDLFCFVNILGGG
jgi:hypothetical protein